MILILMRHGIAARGETWAREDAFRPLTKIGKTRTRKAARGLSTLMSRVDLIASSPLLRAMQTAEIARDFFFNAKFEIWDELQNAEYSSLIPHLKKLNDATVLLIGHEPDFSQLAAQILTGNKNAPVLDFKKSGACALEITWKNKRSTRAPRGVLLWHATPEMLRKIRP